MDRFVKMIAQVMTLMMALQISGAGGLTLVLLMPGVTWQESAGGGTCDFELHRFFNAVARTVVNNDGSGGTAPDASVSSAGSLAKMRRVMQALRDNATLPTMSGCPLGLVPTSMLLVSASVFLGILHWRGASFVDLLILCAGERPVHEKATSSVAFLDELLILPRYPALFGTPPLRYCTAGFASGTPSWKLPSVGQVSSLVKKGVKMKVLVLRLMLSLEELEDSWLEELVEAGRESD